MTSTNNEFTMTMSGIGGVKSFMWFYLSNLSCPGRIQPKNLSLDPEILSDDMLSCRILNGPTSPHIHCASWQPFHSLSTVQTNNYLGTDSGFTAHLSSCISGCRHFMRNRGSAMRPNKL